MALSNALRVGLTGAMATLAREVAADGITVNNVLPGLMDTGALQRVIRARARAGRDLGTRGEGRDGDLRSGAPARHGG